MEKKQHFFIYDRKEVGVLLLLGVMVAVFAFTLGVHLGKRVGIRAMATQESQPVSPVASDSVTTAEDQIRNQPIPPASAAVPTNDVLNRALHDEVTRTGIKLDHPRQVELPDAAHGVSGGAATEASPHPAASDENKPMPAMEPVDAAPASEPGPVSRRSRYVLQVGSYADLGEAKDRARDLEISGLRPIVHGVKVKGKGRWYRIFVGGYVNKAEALKAGQRYRAQGVIASFIVARSVASK